MWERLAAPMQRAIHAALEEAGRRGCREVEPEDLLRAIAKDGESAAHFMLARAGRSGSLPTLSGNLAQTCTLAPGRSGCRPQRCTCSM